jgi:hypothetical protein
MGTSPISGPKRWRITGREGILAGLVDLFVVPHRVGIAGPRLEGRHGLIVFTADRHPVHPLLPVSVLTVGAGAHSLSRIPGQPTRAVLD